jgi:hypothetical protein
MTASRNELRLSISIGTRLFRAADELRHSEGGVESHVSTTGSRRCPHGSLGRCLDHAGGARAAAISTLTESAKRNGLDPAAYLRDILSVIAEHLINYVGDLLLWNRTPDARPIAQAEAAFRGPPQSA